MNSISWALVGAYAVGIGVITFVGGKLSEIGKLTENRVHLVTSLVAGFILGIALFHMLPHSFHNIPDDHAIETLVIWVSGGIVTMIVLMRILDFFQHTSIARSSDTDTHEHIHPLDKRRDFVFLLFGLGLHSVTEGIALGTSTRVGETVAGMLPGLGVCLAIALHKPLDSFSLIAIMRTTEISRRVRTVTNLSFALICPIVTVLFFILAGTTVEADGSNTFIGVVLAFATGVFLYVVLHDLLPDVFYCGKNRALLLVLFILGMALAYVLFSIEETFLHGEHGEHVEHVEHDDEH